jgi:hypothetical protein
MDITQEHELQIQEIMSRMQCSKDFECYKSRFENLCEVRILCDGKLVKCLDENGQICEFGFSFGSGLFCKCPLRKYITENFKI